MPRISGIQIRRDTAANWTSVNPTLLAGEIGVESDTSAGKIGDGSTAWLSLGYAWNPTTSPSSFTPATGRYNLGSVTPGSTAAVTVPLTAQTTNSPSMPAASAATSISLPAGRYRFYVQCRTILGTTAVTPVLSLSGSYSGMAAVHRGLAVASGNYTQSTSSSTVFTGGNQTLSVQFQVSAVTGGPALSGTSSTNPSTDSFLVVEQIGPGASS